MTNIKFNLRKNSFFDKLLKILLNQGMYFHETKYPGKEKKIIGRLLLINKLSKAISD